MFAFAVADAHQLDPLDCWAVGSAVALTVGVTGNAVAHELMHTATRLDRGLAWLLMTLTGYPHFVLAHTMGHHRRVATPADPATARLHESLYAFLPRCVGGSFRDAWRAETRRLRLGRRATWGLANRVLGGVTGCGLFAGGVAAVYGWRGLLAFAAQALIATFYLETINYVQHYGLVRRTLAPGRLEPVGAAHSWDCDWRVTNWLLFNLGRHADHHARAKCPYSDLTHLPAAPRLPAGYTAMVVLALFPPFWHTVMDPRVRAARAQLSRNES